MNKNTSKQDLKETAKDGRAYAEDVELAQEFINYYSTVEKLSEGSRNKYYYCLKAFLTQLRIIGSNAASLDENSVLALMRFLQESTWSEATRADYWDRFTRFWSWAADREADKGTNWDPRAYRLLADPKHKKPYKIDKNREQRKGILTEEEVLKLLHAEDSLQYKAFFSVLFESGMRSGEALSLQLRDVETHDNGTYTLSIRRSKTIRRPITLYGSSTKYLHRWLSLHPQIKDPQAPLWLNSTSTPLNNFAANKELKRLLRYAGIKTERISLHSFRHSCATLWAQRGISEFKMCKHFGWRIGSKMPATYINTAALDARDAARVVQGLPVKEADIKPSGRRCLQCDHLNSFDANLCDNCNLPLDASKLKDIKNNVRAERERELAKRYAKEIFKEEIAAVMKQYNLTVRTETTTGGSEL